MSFAAYNGVQQTTANSCGAFALAAALSHTGYAPADVLINELNTTNLANGFNQPGPRAFAQRLYQITGCLFIDFAPPAKATYQYQKPVADMNPPSALAYMASKMLVPVARLAIRYNNVAQAVFSNITVTNPGVPALNNLLQIETALIHNQYGTVAQASYSALPAANAAHLLLVSNNRHWIAINNTQLYDPATGYVGAFTTTPPVLGPANLMTQLSYTMLGVTFNFDFNGIWIQLTQ